MPVHLSPAFGEEAEGDECEQDYGGKGKVARELSPASSAVKEILVEVLPQGKR